MQNVLPFIKKTDTNVISIRKSKSITPVGQVMTKEEQEFFEDMMKTTGMANSDRVYSKKKSKIEEKELATVLNFKKS